MRRFAALLAGLAFAACAPAAPPVADDARDEAFDEAAARAEIDNLRSGFEEFVATLDMSMAGSMLAEGAVMVPPAGNGWSDMLAAAGGAPYAAGSTASISPIETVFMSPEWAYEMGTSVFTWTPEGGEPIELRDTYLIIFRNQGDGWKIWREVASANLPPEMPAGM